MDLNRIVYMANQIADFFNAYPKNEAINATKEHFEKYWDPRMRKTLYRHLSDGGKGLSQVAFEASKKIDMNKLK